MNHLWFVDGPLEGVVKVSGHGRPAPELTIYQGGYWTYRLVGCRTSLSGDTACFYSATAPEADATAGYLKALKGAPACSR